MTDDTKAARRANGRKVTAALALMVSVAPLTFYAYDVERNVATRPALRRACETIRRELPVVLAPELLRAVIGEVEGPAFGRTIVGWFDRDCRDTDARLAFWRWNLGVRVPLRREPGEEARVHAALGHADERCPQVVRQMLTELPGTRTQAQLDDGIRELCVPLTRSVRLLGRRPTDAVSAWDHAAMLVALAGELTRLESHTH